MKNVLSGLSILGFSALTLTACGDLQLGESVQLVLKPEEQKAQLIVELSDGLEIALAGQFELPKNYGTLTFVPATQTDNSKIIIETDLSAVVGDKLAGLESMTKLPNGAPLPVAMVPPLMVYPVVKKSSVTADVAFSLSPLQIAGIFGIAQFSNKYIPDGIALCQNFRNEKDVAFAAVCIYGPGSNKSGGIFAGANFGDVLNIDSDEFMDLNIKSRSYTPMAKADVLNTNMNVKANNWTSAIHDPAKAFNNSSTVQKTRDNIYKVLRKKN